MPATADALLDLLEERGLLPEFDVQSLRKQVSEAKKQVSATQLAELLFRKGRLTQFQARKLLADLESPDESAPSEQTGRSESPPPASTPPPLEKSPGAEKTDGKQPDPPTARIVDAPQEITSGDLLDDLPDGGAGDLLDETLASDPDAHDPLALPPKKKGWFGGGKKGRRGWDSPLILGGTAAVVVLLLVAAILAFLFTRGSGDDVFNAAEEDYLDGAYGQAIAKYERFLDRHSSHPKASLARVRLGTAQLRQSVGGGNWPAALEKAEEILPQIEAEADFSQARPELASLLPDIAEGFSTAAEAAQDDAAKQQQVDLYARVMKLINTTEYLPGSQRVSIEPRLARIDETMQGVVRDLSRNERLAEAIEAINGAAAAGDFIAAYDTRRQLLREYPRLAANQQLTAAVAEVSKSLVDSVTVVEQSLTPVNEERPTPILSQVALANPQPVDGPPVPADAAGRVAPLFLGGVVYALDATTGKLLWRRDLGSIAQVGPPPVAISDAAESDLLAVDTSNWDLLRLRARSGELVWRLEIGEPFFAPEIAGTQAYLSTAGDQMLTVNIVSGASTRRVKFPQGLAQSPSVSKDGSRLVQLGGHSNLYLLDPQTLECRAVHYLGHDQGAVLHRPRQAAGLALAPLFASLKGAELHIVRLTGDQPRRVQSPIELPGQLGAPLVINRERLLVTTDNGAVQYFDINPASDATDPVTLLAEAPVGEQDGLSAWPLVHQGKLLVGSSRLAAFSLPATRGNLTRRWVENEGRACRGPLVGCGSLAVAGFSQLKGSQAVVAAGYSLEERARPQQPVWATVIAAGSAGKSWLDTANRRMLTVTSAGELYGIDTAATQAGVVNGALATAESPLVLSAPEAVGEGGKFYPTNPPSRRGVLFDTSQPDELTEVQLDIQADKTYTRPTSWRDGLLIPRSFGQVLFVDPKTGKPKLHPFQPPLRPGQPVAWRPTVAVSDTRFAVADEHHIYLVEENQTGAPHLAAAEEATLPQTIRSLAVVGNTLFALINDDERSSLLRLSTDDLSQLGVCEMAVSRLADIRSQEEMLFVKESDKFSALNESGELLWEVSLEDDSVLHWPSADGDRLVSMTVNGHVLSIDKASGRLEQTTNVGQPLRAGPTVIGKRIYVPAKDGTILGLSSQTAE